MAEFAVAVLERGASDLVFYPLSMMHRKLPCAENIFRIKTQYRAGLSHSKNPKNLLKIPLP
jgi:hypothetical protein